MDWSSLNSHVPFNPQSREQSGTSTQETQLVCIAYQSKHTHNPHKCHSSHTTWNIAIRALIATHANARLCVSFSEYTLAIFTAGAVTDGRAPRRPETVV